MFKSSFYTGNNLVREIGKKNIIVYIVSALLLILFIIFGIIHIKSGHVVTAILYFVLALLVLVPNRLMRVDQFLKFIILAALFCVFTVAFNGSRLKGIEKINSPTGFKPTTATKGVVFSEDFELGTGSASATGKWVGDATYHWRFILTAGGVATASFDNTISHSGKQSMKLVADTLGLGKSAFISLWSNASPSIDAQSKYHIKIKPDTTYKVSGWYKLDSVASVSKSSGFIMYLYQYTGVTTTSVGNSSTGFKTGTMGWTYWDKTFTSEPNAANATFIFVIKGETGTAWVDDLKLEEVPTE